ncbi:MAG: hypothetical protein K6T65_08775 [Peptococcaceae bacterium]|nr:hypothetical protein [Peptococcaceae bacterium]
MENNPITPTPTNKKINENDFFGAEYLRQLADALDKSELDFYALIHDFEKQTEKGKFKQNTISRLKKCAKDIIKERQKEQKDQQKEEFMIKLTSTTGGEGVNEVITHDFHEVSDDTVVPPGYILSESGIKKLAYSEEFGEYEELICNFPVIVVRINQNKDKQKSSYVIAYKFKNEWSTVEISPSTLVKNPLTLLDFGLPLNKKQSHTITNYILSYVQTNYEVMQVIVDNDVSVDALSSVVSFVAQNFKRHFAPGVAEAWGKYTKFAGYQVLLVDKYKLSNYLEKEGFVFGQVIDRWRKDNTIVLTSQGKITHRTTLSGKNAYCIAILRDRISKIDAEYQDDAKRETEIAEEKEMAKQFGQHGSKYAARVARSFAPSKVYHGYRDVNIRLYPVGGKDEIIEIKRISFGDDQHPDFGIFSDKGPVGQAIRNKKDGDKVVIGGNEYILRESKYEDEVVNEEREEITNTMAIVATNAKYRNGKGNGGKMSTTERIAKLEGLH